MTFWFSLYALERFVVLPLGLLFAQSLVFRYILNPSLVVAKALQGQHILLATAFSNPQCMAGCFTPRTEPPLCTRQGQYWVRLSRTRANRRYPSQQASAPDPAGQAP